MVDLLGIFSFIHRYHCSWPLQCRHLIPALNAWAALAKYKTTCPIATQFPWHGCMNDLQPNVTLICKLRGSLMFLSYFIEIIHGCLYNQAMADIQSTGAVIKCLYCSNRLSAQSKTELMSSHDVHHMGSDLTFWYDDYIEI